MNHEIPLTDPETGREYTAIITSNGHQVEIDIHRGRWPDIKEKEWDANVCIETYDGKCQVIITDDERLINNGGDDPDVVVLFEDK